MGTCLSNYILKLKNELLLLFLLDPVYMDFWGTIFYNDDNKLKRLPCKWKDPLQPSGVCLRPRIRSDWSNWTSRNSCRCQWANLATGRRRLCQAQAWTPWGNCYVLLTVILYDFWNVSFTVLSMILFQIIQIVKNGMKRNGDGNVSKILKNHCN